MNDIRNIWAVGRNYAEHAKELGNEVPSSPLFFLKAGSCASFAANEIILPAWAEEIHHEVELAVQFDHNLKISQACLALDLTERKKQAELKAKGQAWTLAKSFSGACPLSNFFAVKDVAELSDLEIQLRVNGELRQNGRTSQMLFAIPQLLQMTRDFFPVCVGDLFLTGTPAGVGPLRRGDRVEAQITGKVAHQWLVK